ncbi:seipin [Malurus melanocephalus]|uniref:seipin n=1 Tax=Malurus melanocephalus TaxID=175006 RepID=UPI002548E33C|nr:seipin [Malurus melanocephalus]
MVPSPSPSPFPSPFPFPSWGSRLGRGARRALLRGALGLSLGLLLLWAALFLYGSFYWAYLPAAILLYGQIYRISLELELPESGVNRDLGMFMVGLTCYGNGGKTLATAARSAMLHYRSRLLRALHTVAFAGLFLSGFAEQSQTLEVELMGRYREDPVGFLGKKMGFMGVKMGFMEKKRDLLG